LSCTDDRIGETSYTCIHSIDHGLHQVGRVGLRDGVDAADGAPDDVDALAGELQTQRVGRAPENGFGDAVA